MSSSLHSLREVVTVISVMAGTGFLFADGGSGEDESEVFELSPFTVEADEDLGYLATSTLAGTRLRTDFKDIGASIDVLTLEFLDDIGAVTVEESFLYTAHLENPTETGQDSDIGPLWGSSDLRAGSGVRALGLTAPMSARSYFPALLPLDRYNTERVVIARGPQAILFGLGSPSGIVNSNLKRAHFDEDFLEARTRFDNWGSQRWEADLNQTILEDTLALRLAYVEDRENFWLEPAWDDRIRKYGTLTWTPTDWLTLRLHRETFQRDANVPGTQLPGDHVSYFLEAKNGELLDPMSPRDIPFWARPGSIGVIAHFNYGGQPEPVFMPIDAMVVPKRTAAVISAVSDPESDNYNPADPFFDPEWVSIDDARRTRTLTDDRHYPVYDKYILGEMHPTEQSGDFTTAFLELRLFEDLFLFSEGFLEVAYNQAEIKQRRGGLFNGQQFAIEVDPNRYLPNGEINPNAGKFYVVSLGGWMEDNVDELEIMRVTGSTVMDLTDPRKWLGRHRFGFLFADSEGRSDQQGALRTIGNIGGLIGGKKPEDVVGLSMGGPGTNWAWPGYGRLIASIFYLEEADGILYPTRDMLPWGGPLETWWVPTDEGEFGIYGLDPDGGGAWRMTQSVFQQIESISASWQGWFEFGDFARLAATYGYREDRIRARQRALPESFTNSYGETLSVKPNGRIQETNLYVHYSYMPWEEAWGEPGTLTNDVTAAVLSFDPILDKAFDGAFRMAINYSQSSNNTGLSKLLDADGNFHPGQRGEGENYGFRLELAQSKFLLSMNRWEVDVIGAYASTPPSGVRYRIRDIEQRWLIVEPDSVAAVVAATGGYVPNPDGTDLGNMDPNSFGVFGDQTAKGWTIDLVANPVRGLRIRANLSKTRAVQSNVGTAWIDFVRDVRQPIWAEEIEWWDDSDADGIFRPVLVWDPHLKVDADGNGVVDTLEDGDTVDYLTLGDPGNPGDVANILSGWEEVAMARSNDLSDPQTIFDYYVLDIEADQLLPAEGLDGLSNPTIREWRANATATYTFQEGPLENWTLGGSVRYRDEQFIGAQARFVELTLTDGSSLQVATEDPSQPLYGEDFWFFDFLLGYSGSFALHGSRITFGIQLNIRNLLDEDSTYITDATSTGRPVRVSRNIPREIYLSTSIRF